MMSKLNDLYRQLLHFGLLGIREALQSNDYEWAEQEAEFLHNVPSLIGEANPRRHEYFWAKEREAYLRWAEACQSERVQWRMRNFYLPLFVEMEPLQQNFSQQQTNVAS